MARKRVLVVDDHPVVRRGVMMIIGQDPEYEVCGEAATALEAIAEALRLRPDLVVLDLNLPDHNGFYVLGRLQRELPGVPVLILSVQPEEHMAVRALKSGASGFLNKESAPEELVRALRQIGVGRRYISAQFAEWLALDASGHRESLPHERLSEREMQVMLMLAQGESVSGIAAALHRSPNTISTYRARILNKMGFDNNAALTEYALVNHLIR
jgi:DNA-binding NarL/FixJ family response regulator